MKLGQFNICPLTDGRFRLDGGAMFGVVPRVLWEQCCPADDLNRIPLSLTCLLIQAHGKNILVDTGLGTKNDEKFHRMWKYYLLSCAGGVSGAGHSIVANCFGQKRRSWRIQFYPLNFRFRVWSRNTQINVNRPCPWRINNFMCMAN